MSGSCIRSGQVSDADDVGRFQTRCWDQTYRGLVPDSYLDGTTWQMRSARWRDRMVSGDRQVWLAEDSGHLVGVASTSRPTLANPQLPGLELSSIYVDAAAHGSGIAAALLGAAITTEPAHLWVFVSNLRAQRFYSKHRFHASGETRVDPIPASTRSCGFERQLDEGSADGRSRGVPGVRRERICDRSSIVCGSSITHDPRWR